MKYTILNTNNNHIKEFDAAAASIEAQSVTDVFSDDI